MAYGIFEGTKYYALRLTLMRPLVTTVLVFTVTVIGCFSIEAVMAQFGGGGGRFIQRNLPPPGPPEPAEFTFVRLIYKENTGGRQGFYFRGGGGWEAWMTDWPDAEYHLSQGINRLTQINVPTHGHRLSVLDDDIFDYPWLYAVEVGNWYFNDEEAARLREYLIRGGFLVVDDFHGDPEWVSFLTGMKKVFPNRSIVELSADHESMHTLYDLDKRIQIPSRMYSRTGVTYEKGGITPHWRGIFDDDGRLMVIINFNMDLGDAWEHADWPDYPEEFTALAYRFGINYVIYSMTH